MTVTLSDVRAAAAALAGSIVATPCTLSRTLSELTGARVTIKFENLQFTASFKERGALVKLKNLTATAAQRGVIAVRPATTPKASPTTPSATSAPNSLVCLT